MVFEVNDSEQMVCVECVHACVCMCVYPKLSSIVTCNFLSEMCISMYLDILEIHHIMKQLRYPVK